MKVNIIEFSLVMVNFLFLMGWHLCKPGHILRLMIFCNLLGLLRIILGQGHIYTLIFTFIWATAWSVVIISFSQYAGEPHVLWLFITFIDRGFRFHLFLRLRPFQAEIWMRVVSRLVFVDRRHWVGRDVLGLLLRFCPPLIRFHPVLTFLYQGAEAHR